MYMLHTKLCSFLISLGMVIIILRLPCTSSLLINLLMNYAFSLDCALLTECSSAEQPPPASMDVSGLPCWSNVLVLSWSIWM